MTDAEPPLDPELTDEDRRLFEALDCGLLSDDDARRFRGLLDCVDQLDSFAIRMNHNPPAEERGRASGTAAFPRPFGRYELLAELGRGGMGVVYRARHVALNQLVALKMVRASAMASEDETARFAQEARIAAGLHHPNLIRVLDVGEQDGLHYLTMDLIEGETLAARLRRGPLPADDAARLVLQIADAIDYLHQRGVIHRDLKPSNIIVTADNRPVVTDFGLVKSISQDDDSLTITGTILGTPGFMAPEQASNEKFSISTLTDVYGIGVVLYACLTGQPPFHETNPLDTLLQVLEAEPPAPRSLVPSVPAKLQAICLRCLEKSPARRFASATDVTRQLQRYLNHEPVPMGGWRRHFLRWIRREPALASHWLAIAVAMFIIQTQAAYRKTNIPEHRAVMLFFGVWAVGCWGLQRLIHRIDHRTLARFLWATLDTVILSLLISLAEDVRSQLYIGYPVLITAAGLWFQVRLVSYTTALCLTGFLTLNTLYPDPGTPGHHPWIFSWMLLLLGLNVAYQVQRVRVLSRHYGMTADGSTLRGRGKPA